MELGREPCEQRGGEEAVFLMFLRGDILIASFPYDDGPGYKLRPVLFWGYDGGDVVVSMITSKFHDYEWQVPLPEALDTGLDLKSYVRLDRTRALSVSKVGMSGAVGRLDDDTMDVIAEKMREYRKKFQLG